MSEATHAHSMLLVVEGEAIVSETAQGGVLERGPLTGGKVSASSREAHRRLLTVGGEVCARLAAGTPEDVTRAADAAEAAFPRVVENGGVERRDLPERRQCHGRAQRGGHRAMALETGAFATVLGVQRGAERPDTAGSRGGDHSPGRRTVAHLIPGAYSMTQRPPSVWWEPSRRGPRRWSSAFGLSPSRWLLATRS